MRWLLLLVLALSFAPTRTAQAVTDNQALMKVDLMVVTAHPDDEGMCAATMARLSLDGGKTVALVTATRGETGGNSTGKEFDHSLGVVRETELRRCLAVLGVKYLKFLDVEDFAYTESAMATLERWGHEETLRRLVRLVRLMRPEVIVTMDPAPTGGQHGNHQVAGRLATEAYEAAADPAQFPELLRHEGLTVWRVKKLYYASGNGATLSVPTDAISPSRGKSYAEIAGEGERNHRSQGFDKFFGSVRPARGTPRPEWFVRVKSRVPIGANEERDLPDGVDDAAAAMADLSAKPERFSVAMDEPFKVQLRLANLSDQPLHGVVLRLQPPAGNQDWGLHGATIGEIATGAVSESEVQVQPRGLSPGQRAVMMADATWDQGGRHFALREPVEIEAAPTVSLSVRPSPAVAEFRHWSEAQGIERLIARLPAHVPVTIGDATDEVAITLDNHGAALAQGELRVELPAAWHADPPPALSYRLEPGARRDLTLPISVPASAPQGDAAFNVISGPAKEAAVFEVLPKLTVRRIKSPMPVDADPAKWTTAGFAAQAIPATALAQGEISGPQEASGKFYVGYDDEALQVLVDVTDDTVVANIAPDDIKAHWRSTSTEIAIDPHPRSENTLGAFKLGIFPADTAGHVRAARDADANPGPVEEVDPGVKLASRRTPSGYIVEARIPFASLAAKGRPAVRPTPGGRLGFDVILYHAGKKQAAVGEDINKARLAWAYRGGVWGRPISWGTAILQ